MANAAAITLRAVASAAAGSDEGDAVDLGETRSAAKLALTVTAVSGSLKTWVETSPDGTTGWERVASFEDTTTVSRQRRAFDGLEQYVRLAWTVSVGGSATFGVEGKAHTLFALRDDLLAHIAQNVIDECEKLRAGCAANALIVASCHAEDAIGIVHPLALTDWSESLTDKTAALAAFGVSAINRQVAGVDEIIVKRNDDAIAWFRGVKKREHVVAGNTPAPTAAVRSTSGNGEDRDTYAPKFSNNWGDFG